MGRAALLAKVGTESIWTVDLLFLLQVRPCVFFFLFLVTPQAVRPHGRSLS